MKNEYTYRIFPTGPLECNTIAIYSETTKETILIDPGEDYDEIINIIESNSFNVQILLHTHAHIDHIDVSKKLKQEFKIPIYLHSQDNILYKNLPTQALVLGKNTNGYCEVDHFFEDNEIISLNDFSLKVIHTPGHSEGGSSFFTEYFETPTLFCGDTLFNNSIGRTDLPGGNFDKIINSIQTKLFTLPPNTCVIPGHGYNTTIEFEKNTNPFF